ncbi:hypothetical protein SDC9_173231 [bioreactor metagenome]|uniref:Uncharacterized protein n=1 Tax=bioreactor metagenome TaxID=1076179 RepID=A0A645GGK9_9ZZZZ
MRHPAGRVGDRHIHRISVDDAVFVFHARRDQFPLFTVDHPFYLNIFDDQIGDRYLVHGAEVEVAPKIKCPDGDHEDHRQDDKFLSGYFPFKHNLAFL